MRTAAILPVKRFAEAKQRLGPALPGTLRVELARAMVGDVLVALGAVPELDQVVVVTGERPVAAAAAYLDYTVVDDDSDAGQSAAAALGIARAVADGAQRVLLLPGDCPALSPAELSALLGEAAGGREVVILPDRHGTGTNGLLLTPPDVIAPSFGTDSCERHRGLAQAAGATCRVRELPSLLLDIDTGSDLQALRERLAAHEGGAARTRAILAGAPGPVPAG